MGVGSSREIEEQLEAALALLDSARTKQEQLTSENDALQARITAQAARSSFASSFRAFESRYMPVLMFT